MCGLGQTMENSAAYIADWLGVLDRDKSVLVNAASMAQKAADWILGSGE
jgi:antirestriction protein ArdC